MLLYNNLEEYVKGQREKLDKLNNANIPERGLIIKVLISSENQDKETNIKGYSITNEIPLLLINTLGILGDRHYREVRNSTGRERELYQKGTIIREHRHVFAVSHYDCKVLIGNSEARL